VDGGRRGTPRQARGRLFRCGCALRSRSTAFAQDDRHGLRRKYGSEMPPGGAAFLFGAGGGRATWSVRVSAGEDLSAENAGKATPPAARPAAAEPLPRAASPSPQSGPTLTGVQEVRGNDFGWGQANDRNLPGRFSTQEFSPARLAELRIIFCGCMTVRRRRNIRVLGSAAR
jgi:hypothetical protein